MTAATATNNAQLESLKTVKLSKQTINFLKNFSQINKSILIKRGQFIDTISVNKNIIAYTEIKEFFRKLILSLISKNTFLMTWQSMICLCF